MLKHHQTLCFQHFCALRLLDRKSFSTVNSPIQNAKKPTALPLVTNRGHNERVKSTEFQAENSGGGSIKFGGFNLPPSAVPNLNILDKIVSKAGQRMPPADCRRKFDRIVAEINFLYSISTEVPAELNEEQWLQLLHTASVLEREHLLRNIYYAKLAETKPRKKQQSQKFNLKNKAIDGEAEKECHSKAIYDTFDDKLWGKTGLKNRKDAHFGEALCQNFALEPSNRMPKLLVDCRFMYAHKLAHILSAANSAPFPICIANFFADDTLNRIVKSQWHFLYGTPSEQAALGCARFVPHPFAPEVSTRGVTELCERDAIPKDRIAYVSQKAAHCLPDNLSQFSAFVLLPFDDWEQRLLSTKAALAENIPCYRLPLDQHIRGVSRNIPCWLVANILREVYIGRMSWAKVAQRWGREFTHRPNAEQSDPPEQLPFLPEPYEEKKKLRAKILEKLEQYSDMLNNVTTVVGGVESKGKKQQQNLGVRHAGRERLTPALVTAIKKRKYSREERNRRRLEAKKDGEIDDKKSKNYF
uniref:SAM-dependent MTase TRM10-type domain-containing protein n=1 Tax=Globodera rostochiensis TaxID=31243 RepID=A0A914HT36_GLORO